MKTPIILAAAAALLAGCDARITPLPAEKPVEKNTTTIVNPPAKEENKTIIVNPPAKEETKIEKKTIINPSAPTTTEEKKTTTTIK